MIAEIGQFSINLAMAITIMLGVILLVSAHYSEVRFMALSTPSSISVFLLLTVAMICLTISYVESDFSLHVVFQNSHTLKPLIYKISGVWGNHEGSLLLWIWVLSFMGLLVGLFAKDMSLTMKARTIGVLSVISAAFLIFMIFTSNPFSRLYPVPLEGNDLNPLLQDPGLAFHPPMLYIGYVGLSVAFAIAIAGLLEKKIDVVWAHNLRPWVLFAWIFLTAGIALGSWWAYYELGWGGFWFWDPVENASFMPWLITTALLHSVIVAQRRGALKSWTVLLAICGFSLSLIGTFIVRSGIITSVHAFATDPERGVFILLLLSVVIGVSLLLYAFTAPKLDGGGYFSFESRETGILLNNWLLACASATVFIGTLFPLFLEAVTGDKITVGPPYFNYSFIPIMLIIFIAIAIGPLISWKKGSVKKAILQLRAVFAISVCIAFIFAYIYDYQFLSAFIGGLCGFWVILATLYEFFYKNMGGKFQISLWKRALKAPLARWGSFLAHMGIGVFVIGAVGASVLSQELVLNANEGQQLEISGITLSLDKIHEKKGPNWFALEAILTIKNGALSGEKLLPQKRKYVVGGRETTEAAIASYFFYDIYVALGERKKAGIDLRIYYKPFAPFLWFGSLLLVIGGICSIFDRKLYIASRNRKLYG